jgi:hypothetical protein
VNMKNYHKSYPYIWSHVTWSCSMSIYMCLQILFEFLCIFVMDVFVTATLPVISSVKHSEKTDWLRRWRHWLFETSVTNATQLNILEDFSSSTALLREPWSLH